MQKSGFLGAVLFTAALLSVNAVFACGDKLLVIGRGVRFQHAYTPRPANLLIYSKGTASGADLRSARLQAMLKQAGHKLQMVDRASQLNEALRSGKVDVVLADFADVAGIAQQLQSAPSNPIVLPVLFKPAKAELAAAQRDYRFALKAPTDVVQYLTAIDAAMKVRLRTSGKS